MIALVGLGFSAFDLFLRYKNQKAAAVEKKVETDFTAVETFVPPDEKFHSTPHPQYGME